MKTNTEIKREALFRKCLNLKDRFRNKKFSFLVIILVCFLSFPSISDAQGIFGGRINSFTFCSCNTPPSYLLYIGPPVPATVMFVPGASNQFSYYQIPRPGIWVLGAYVPGGIPCLIYVGKGCAPLGAGTGIISIVGTSM